MRILVDAKNWTQNLCAAIESAEQGDTLVVGSEELSAAAEAACEPDSLNRPDLKIVVGSPREVAVINGDTAVPAAASTRTQAERDELADRCMKIRYGL